jgi:hypothetical protein
VFSRTNPLFFSLLLLCALLQVAAGLLTAGGIVFSLL